MFSLAKLPPDLQCCEDTDVWGDKPTGAECKHKHGHALAFARVETQGDRRVRQILLRRKVPLSSGSMRCSLFRRFECCVLGLTIYGNLVASFSEVSFSCLFFDFCSIAV